MLAPSSVNRASTGKIWGTDLGDGAEDDLDEVLQDERHADGRDERRQSGGVPEWPVGESLDAHAQQTHHRHRDDERDAEDADEQQRIADGPVKPMLVEITNDRNAPTMKMSPWAKLMSSMMP